MSAILSSFTEEPFTKPEVLSTEPYQSRLLHLKRRDHLPSEAKSYWRIQSGYIRTFTWSLEGECVPLGFWQQGEVVGQTIAQAHPYEAQCLSDVTVEYLGSDYGFSRESVLAQVGQSNSLLCIVHCFQVEQRLLLFFVWLAQRLGEAIPSGYRIRPKLTHQDIADSVNSTRVTVTRSIKVLERAGKIRWSPRERVVYRSAVNECCGCLCEVASSSTG